jgi:hypothetical protein
VKLIIVAAIGIAFGVYADCYTEDHFVISSPRNCFWNKHNMAARFFVGFSLMVGRCKTDEVGFDGPGVPLHQAR